MSKIKIISFLLMFALSFSCAEAKKLNIEDIIKKSGLDESATVAVSVKDAKSGNVEFEYNQHKLLHPASILKVLTLTSALNTLGMDYKFKTTINKSKNNDIYIKLGADPFLTTKQLKNALSKVKGIPINNFYIDDKVIDRQEWGTGWMWDDETNSRMAKISPYNLDKNLVTLKVSPTTIGEQAKIVALNDKATAVFNLTTSANKTDVHTYRQNAISPNMLYVWGNVANEVVLNVPVSSPERVFVSYVEKLVNDSSSSNIAINISKTPENTEMIAAIENDIKPAISAILTDSDNFYAETVFKVAGGKFTNSQGSFSNSKTMFDKYYESLGLNMSDVVLADASGVSRNNLISADWVSEAFCKIQSDKNFHVIRENMATPSKGTLKNRMQNLEGKVWAKTGTLANISTIAGYVVDEQNKEHVFVIFVQNAKQSDVAKVRALQDEIIMNIQQRRK